VIRVLFVCAGNICRSPTAEAVFRRQLTSRGLADRVQVDSAGTGGWHAGQPPDPRAVEAAARRGIVLTGTARQVRPADFHRFDVIVAVDAENMADLRRVAPRGTAAKIRMLATEDVPDPYYGGPTGFDDVLDRVEQACAELLDELVVP
jgi:protein-tyrosine phosphatase